MSHDVLTYFHHDGILCHCCHDDDSLPRKNPDMTYIMNRQIGSPDRSAIVTTK